MEIEGNGEEISKAYLSSACWEKVVVRKTRKPAFWSAVLASFLGPICFDFHQGLDPNNTFWHLFLSFLCRWNKMRKLVLIRVQMTHLFSWKWPKFWRFHIRHAQDTIREGALGRSMEQRVSRMPIPSRQTALRRFLQNWSCSRLIALACLLQWIRFADSSQIQIKVLTLNKIFDPTKLK